MVKDEIHKNDIGTLFKLTVKDEDSSVVNLSSASTKEILIEKPDTTVLTKTASFTTDGTDGLIEYNTISGDIDTIGKYKIQGKVILSGSTWYTDIKTFYVNDNLE